MSRIGNLLVMVLLLVGCRGANPAMPSAESRVPPNLGVRFFTPEGWAWGYVQTGRWPAQRYGVASTSRVPAAQFVILPGYGESAEVWFETARDLVQQGNTVWILERAGQGGSGRYAKPHDLGYVPSFEPDVSALKALLKVIVRPSPEVPVILLGHADGALVALRAAQTGARVDGVIASSPRFVPISKVRVAGLDRLPGPGWRPWSRTGLDGVESKLTHDPVRGGVGLAWQTANPDLRMSGPSRAWDTALAELSRQVMDRAPQSQADTLAIQGEDASGPTQDFCDRARNCHLVTVVGARPALHLEADAWRSPWLAAVNGFIAAKADAARQPHKR